MPLPFALAAGLEARRCAAQSLKAPALRGSPDDKGIAASNSLDLDELTGSAAPRKAAQAPCQPSDVTSDTSVAAWRDRRQRFTAR